MQGVASQVQPDSSPLHRLIYRSVVATTQGNAPFTDDVQAILQRARAYNPTIRVTGALITGNGQFAQILEGPFRTLRLLYGAIACDPRHRNVLLLESAGLEERDFAGWSMAYVGASEPPLLDLMSWPEGLNLSARSPAATALLEYLRYALRGEGPGLG